MATYRVVVLKSAEKEIGHLPIQVRRRVVARILALATEPRPHGVQKLTGEDRYRVRQGDHRILYEIEDQIVTVTVVRVAHRSDVYRR